MNDSPAAYGCSNKITKMEQTKQTKQEYHNRMKPLKEAYDKVVKEMLKQPASFEQAMKEQASLRAQRNKSQ